MNDLEGLEITDEPIMIDVPEAVQVYGKERPRTPLGQLPHGRTSRTIRNNMLGLKYHNGAKSGMVGIVPNVRNFAKHATRGLRPQPRKIFGGRGIIVRRASRHARRKYGRRYRSQHTRR